VIDIFWCAKYRAFIPLQAIWRGLPTKRFVEIIQSLTMKDSNDQMYWRKSAWEPWRRLDRPTRFQEYEAFNRVLNRLRPDAHSHFATRRTTEMLAEPSC
jgi:hypothetical protein